ncbi:MAG TPA: tRNA pseudouridine(55) synthase TruB [candidate division Zixibacteria bacterium]|jgi:tRNA pseudouridine55 synthase|nr:tRNA pseudouridine(55) synthase TruB [candidate division Zixibacteria bacterium]
MDAVLNIDKPPGPTSFAAVARIRRLCRVPKAGHAGTLDPLASGVLLVLLGQATRIARYLEALPKEYEAVIRLGVETDTDDLEGAVLSEKVVPALSRDTIEETLAVFSGDIEQVPPRYSALKKDGVPLYKLARQGRPVDPAPRRVTVHAIELLSLGGAELAVRVGCSKGTYVRSLARDIGRALGCGGALAELTRTAVGDFRKDGAAPLDGLDREAAETRGISMDRALAFLPGIELTGEEAVKAGHGNVIQRSSGLAQGSAFRLRRQGSLLAVGREAGGVIHPECVFVSKEGLPHADRKTPE